MKRALILIAILATAAHGQTRNARSEVAIPAPGSTGTVTLSLAEYNRLTELAAQAEDSEAAPLPFVMSSAVFKLRVVDQSTGNVEFVGPCWTKDR